MARLLVWQRAGVPWLQRAGVPSWQSSPGALPPGPSGGTPGSRCAFLPLPLSPEGIAKEQKTQGLVFLHFQEEMQLE